VKKNSFGTFLKAGGGGARCDSENSPLKMFDPGALRQGGGVFIGLRWRNFLAAGCRRGEPLVARRLLGCGVPPTGGHHPKTRRTPLDWEFSERRIPSVDWKNCAGGNGVSRKGAALRVLGNWEHIEEGFRLVVLRWCPRAALRRTRRDSGPGSSDRSRGGNSGRKMASGGQNRSRQSSKKRA